MPDGPLNVQAQTRIGVSLQDSTALSGRSSSVPGVVIMLIGGVVVIAASRRR